MSYMRKISALAVAVVLGAGCAANQGAAAGQVIYPSDSSATVVLHVDNSNTQSMELRAVVNGRSQMVGTVGAEDTTSILLDPALFPTAYLYVVAIPANGRGRAFVGPIAATRGETILLSVLPQLDLSHAIVTR